MNNLTIKLISLSIILLFLLSPLGAVDLDGGDNATHIDIDNDTDTDIKEDVNNTIDVVDVDKNKIVNDTSIEVDEDKKDIKNDTVIENKTLNDSDSSQKLKKADLGLSVEVDDVFLGEKPVVHVKADHSFNGDVDLEVNSGNYNTVKLVNGEGNITLDELDSGTYTATVSFDGNDRFAQSKDSTKFTVNGHDPNLSISVDDVYPGEKPVIKVKANESFTRHSVSLHLKPKNPLHPEYNTHVLVNDGEGTLTIDRELNAEDYTADLSFFGDDYWNPCNASTNFTIYDHKLDSDIDISVPDIFADQKPVVKVKANEGVNGNADIKLKSNKDDVNATVKLLDGEGTVTVNEYLPYGDYSASVYFNGTDIYNPSNASTAFSVKRHDPQLHVSVDDVMPGNKPVVEIKGNASLYGYAEVVFFDSNSNPICGIGNIKVEHGLGNYTFDNVLATGNYTAVLNYYGDDVFLPSNASTNFTAHEHRFDCDIDISVDDVFVDQKPVIKVKANEPVNCNVDVKLKSNNYSEDATVKLVDGECNVTLNDCLPYGDYSASVYFNGTDIYNPSNASTDFTVKRYTPQLQVSVDDVTSGTKPVVKISGNESLHGNAELILINSNNTVVERVDNITVDGGFGNYTVEKDLEPGRYTVLINYYGDDMFISMSVYAIFTVN